MHSGMMILIVSCESSVMIPWNSPIMRFDSDWPVRLGGTPTQLPGNITSKTSLLAKLLVNSDVSRANSVYGPS